MKLCYCFFLPIFIYLLRSEMSREILVARLTPGIREVKVHCFFRDYCIFIVDDCRYASVFQQHGKRFMSLVKVQGFVNAKYITFLRL